MEIKNAQYTIDLDGNNNFINANIDGQDCCVPLVVGNRHYDEMMKQVKEGTLTIKDAD
tara:strand:+ start:350 stop:523 length:174 start_codon:yes stop_codon:yes gene_type:complete